MPQCLEKLSIVKSICKSQLIFRGLCGKSLKLCPTLCDHLDYSLPGSSVHGVLQARILEARVLPYPPPGDLPNPGIKPASLVSPTLAGGFFTTSAPWLSTNCLSSCNMVQQEKKEHNYEFVNKCTVRHNHLFAQSTNIYCVLCVRL